MGLVFEWTKSQGGVEEMERRAHRKSRTIYKLIDESNGFYSCPVKTEFRSKMNIPFRIKETDLEGQFLNQAKKMGMIQLKGHRYVFIDINNVYIPSCPSNPRNRVLFKYYYDLN